MPSEGAAVLMESEGGGLACLPPSAPFAWTESSALGFFCIKYQERAKLGQHQIALWITKTQHSYLGT